MRRRDFCPRIDGLFDPEVRSVVISGIRRGRRLRVWIDADGEP
jgi:hypothetical protein